MSAATHRRLLPAALGAMGVLLAVKLAMLAAAPPGTSAADASGLVGSANASETAAGTPAPRAAKEAAPTSASDPAQASGTGPAACGPDPQRAAATPEQRAEREVLQALRARRAELDAREQALLTREVVAEATERRAAQRLEELSALQRRADAASAGERERSEREEASWQRMVKLYEGMRPRDAAAVFDELELPVLAPLVERLRDAKAAPILGAMRPDRARALTAELARHRAARLRD